MKKIFAIVLVFVMAVSVCACAPKQPENPDEKATFEPTTNPNEETTLNPGEESNKGIKVGVILIGDENEGYTKAHIDGIEAAREKLGLSKEQIVYKYKVKEDDGYEVAVDLAELGCNVIFANSFGYESHMIRAAKEYPEIIFCHATGQNAAKEKDLNNIFNYFNAIYESRYISGVVAGMKLKQLMDEGLVTDPHIGYVGAYAFAEVKSGFTSFFLGIRSVVPEAHMDVQYTNAWFDLNGEAEAANALMAKGCVIIGQHSDSNGAPSAVQAEWEKGKQVYSVGYNIDMLNVAPDAALTSAQNDWSVYYTYAIEKVMKGEKPEQDWCSGYKDGAVKISPLGKSCAPGTQEAVDKTIADITAGTLHIFDCNNFTVNGEHLTSYDQSFGFEGTQLIWDGYFHESEVISAPLFDIIIDGITELNK